MNARSLFVAIALVFSAVSAAAQQPDTTLLDPVVVTATRLPQPRSAAISAVSVIDGDELRDQGVTTVAEALRQVAGLHVVESGTYGSATSLFVRGGESDYVKVLVDGTPVNQPGGAYDFADLTLDNIERIEIVRGPTSVLYGSDALAGVVQIFTRRGRGRLQGEASVRGGTYSSVEVDASAAGGTDAIDFGLGLRRSTTDGVYEFNSQYDNLVLSGSVGAHLDRRTRATISARYGDSEFHFPTDGSGSVVDRNAFQSRKRLSASLELSRRVTPGVEALALLALSRTAGGMEDRPDDAADTLGFFGFVSDGVVTRSSVDLRTNLRPARRVVLSVGAQLERQREESSSESFSEFGPSVDLVEARRLNRGYYLQVQLDSLGVATLNGGVRVDDNDTFGRFFTYRGGAAIRLGGGRVVRGSLGRGFKEPTFYENFAGGPFVVGNPDLQPERSSSWEIGFEQLVYGAGLAFGATYFWQRFDNLIQYNAIPANPGDPNYVNVAAARAAGVELEVSGAVSSRVSLGGSYTYLASEVTDAGLDTGPDAGFVTGQRLLRRPTHRAGLNGSYTWPGWGMVALSIDHVGTRDDRDFSSFPAKRVELPAYTAVDVAGDFTLLGSHGQRPGLALTLRAENLFDRLYQEIVGFPARGRVVWVGVRVGRGR